MTTQRPHSLVFLLWMLAVSVALLARAEPVTADPVVNLFKATDSRGLIKQAQYAFDPHSGELRVRLTLDNREVKSGHFTNPSTVSNLLYVLNTRSDYLLCVYDGNRILSVVVSRDF